MSVKLPPPKHLNVVWTDRDGNKQRINDIATPIGDTFTGLSGTALGSAVGRLIDHFTKDVDIDLDTGKISRRQKQDKS